MKQVETITWLPYPENKPDLRGVYMTTEWIGKNIYCVTTCYWSGYNWYVDQRESLCNGETNKSVIAFLEKPLRPYNPDAKTFNFMTALELMKQGKICNSLNTSIRYVIDDNGLHGIDFDSDSVIIDEIESDWELADEQ